MSEIVAAFAAAISLVVGLDPELGRIVALSIRVSLVAVILAACIGLPLGAALAVFPFPGRRVVIVLFNALMGLPPVAAKNCGDVATTTSGLRSNSPITNPISMKLR